MALVAFEHWPLIPAAIVVVGGFVLLAVAIGRLSNRWGKKETRRDHNDLAGFIFAVLGVIYAVLLGFISVGVWERFTAAETRTYDEAGSLAIVYRDSEGFPEGAEIRRGIRAYVNTIVRDEWPRMQDGEESRVAEGEIENVARMVRRAEPKTAGQNDLHAAMLTAVTTALLDREARLSEDSTGLNAIMWLIVLAGAVITVSFTYLFGFTQEVMQTAMIGTLSLLIGLVIFLTMSLDYPFRGAIQVSPEAFTHVLMNLDHIDSFAPNVR